MLDLDRFNTNGNLCVLLCLGWGRPADWRQESERKVDASGVATWGGDAYRPCDRSQVYPYNGVDVKSSWEFLVASVFFWANTNRGEGPAMTRQEAFDLHRS